MSRYTDLLGFSAEVAERVGHLKPWDRKSRWVRDHARTLADATTLRAQEGHGPGERFALHAERWMETSGEAKVDPDLWFDLMTLWPMGLFAHRAAEAVERLKPNSVLEVGAGVGNTSRLLDASGVTTPGRFVRTDLSMSTMWRHPVPSSMANFNFDEPLPDVDWAREKYDVAVAVNALHCAESAAVSIRTLLETLRPGGTLVIAEGAPMVDGIPWALTWAFGIMDGWWDRGGFAPLGDWRQCIPKDAPTRIELIRQRDGDHLAGMLMEVTRV